MKKILLTLLALSLFADNRLSEKVVIGCLNENNPFVAQILLRGDKALADIHRSRGAFDVDVVGGYEKKRYPLSDAEYMDIRLQKLTLSGAKVSLGYRKSVGVQEYNNIKTGKEGEWIGGVSLPIRELVAGQNSAKLQSELAKKDAKVQDFDIALALQRLYAKVLESYYDTLYARQYLHIQQKLLRNAKARLKMVKKMIAEGSLAKIDLVNMQNYTLEQQIELQKVRALFEAKKAQLGSYLQTPHSFLLPNLPDRPFSIGFDEIMKKRYDLKKLETQLSKLEERKRYVSMQKYPSLDVGIYGVQDRYYQKNGTKTTFSLRYPLQQNDFKGKAAKIRADMAILQAQKASLTAQIKADYERYMARLKALSNSTDMQRKTISLKEEFLQAQKRKFALGSTSLLELNRAETALFKAKIAHLRTLLEKNLVQTALKEMAAKLGG